MCRRIFFLMIICVLININDNGEDDVDDKWRTIVRMIELRPSRYLCVLSLLPDKVYYKNFCCRRLV